jgi:hypothetical protein
LRGNKKISSEASPFFFEKDESSTAQDVFNFANQKSDTLDNTNDIVKNIEIDINSKFENKQFHHSFPRKSKLLELHFRKTSFNQDFQNKIKISESIQNDILQAGFVKEKFASLDLKNLDITQIKKKADIRLFIPELNKNINKKKSVK